MKKGIMSVSVLLLVLLPYAVFSQSEEAEVYFNAGTEKYLQGNFTEAVENLEKAQALDPKNTKIKELMVKILLEGATQNHISRNYRQAMIYLEKARALDPGNRKVDEMYKLTRELLNPTEEKIIKREKKPDKIPQGTMDAEKQNKEAVTKQAAKTARQVREKKKAQADSIKKKVKKYEAPGPPAAGKKGHMLSPAVIAAAIALFFLALCLYSVVVISGLKRRISGMKADIRNFKDEKNNLVIELEKFKERLKYEHQMVENLTADIKESNKIQEEHINREIDNYKRHLEMKYRSDMIKKQKPLADEFMQYHQKTFENVLSETSEPIGESEPALDSARERIALMAQNLYEYAPGAATDFVNRMVKNENPLIRTNIVQALAYIARPETLEILFKMYNDKDLRVKREVLKNLKMLKQKAAAGAIYLKPEALEKVNALLEQEKSKGEWII
ncbi:MAG: tetratricopeptide repeat protein [Endomicrobiales bacterium]|nr:tetratricopeptide repeat protein [Endomicrobiales bacterium]